MKRTNRCMALSFGILLLFAVSASAATIQKGPYLQNVDTTGVTVCWVTDVDTTSVVEYGASRRLGKTTAEKMTRRERYERVWSVGGESQLVAFHQVRLTGLRPDTQYFYRVRTGDEESDIHTFSTAVRAGEEFTFVVFGDTRPTENHRNVVNRVLQLDPQPKFVLHTGDMISNGQRWPDWQGFFDYEAPLLANVPLYSCLGNHERNAYAYFALFALPGNERWYSFDYGDAHIIALDANGPYRNDGAQKAWLIRDLRRHWNSPYTFVFFHQPIYSCTNDLGRRVGGLDMARNWQPIFAAYGVTAVFNGHDHNYQHSLVGGVHHIVSGGGGASIYPVRPRSFTVKAAPIYHIVRVSIGPKEAAFSVIKADDGKVVETFSVPRRDTRSLEYKE